MSELRDKIAEIIDLVVDCGPSGEIWNTSEAAERILAIPDIAALLAVQRSLPPGAMINGVPVGVTDTPSSCSG